MRSPLSYHRSCVPVALSALLDLPAPELAEMLWKGGAARMAPGVPAESVFPWGTRVPIALDRLEHHHGVRAQRWNPDGTLSLDAWEVGYLARAVAHRMATEVYPIVPPRAPEPEVVRLLPEDQPAGGEPPLLTVRGWQERFPFGRWLITVPMTDGGTHALAMRDGEIIAGGAGHRSRPVLEAYRLLLPTERN